MNSEQVEKLLDKWPSQEQIEELKVELKENQKFAENEAFFRALVMVPDLKDRLIVWNFSTGFTEKIEARAGWYDVIELYEAIEADDYFKEMLGWILAVGNILNGGDTKKGQADGF